MQAQELLLGLRLPELDDLGQLFRSLPTSTLVGLGALTAVLAYWLATRPRGIAPPCDLSNQSEKVEGGGRRSMLGDSPELLTHYFEDATTLYEVFQRGLHVSGDGPCLGSRLPNQPYKWLSYKEVMTRAEHLGSGLLYQGCQPNSDQLVGVFAQNRPEWIIAELACYTYSMVVVPLYDTLGPDAIRYIINIAEISTVICDKPEKAKVLLGNVERQETPGLKRIILMDLFDPELVEQGNNSGVHIQSLKDVERFLLLLQPPRPDDLSIVCFTSGTTGNPKGVMLTHGNVVADFAGFLKVTDKVIRPNKDDVLISFLPLAHMFERLIEAVVYCHGGRIGFFQGDIRLLSEDMKVLRPTIFPVVPRLLNRMYDKIFSQANNSVKRWILNFAAKRKAAEVSRGVIRSDSIWDKIFFSKIQASLGGRLRMIITGAAPTSPTVLGFLRAALGCQVYEAYGQTECTAGCTYTTPGDWTSVLPLPTAEIKSLVTLSKAVNSAMLLSESRLKNLNEYYCFVGPLACLVAIVVPDPEVMPSWARKKGLDGSYEDLCKNGELKKAILEDLVRLGKASGLHSFEQVKNIYVHSDMFSIENGLLTPTLKAKRPELRQYFKQEIEELYQNITM
uniref:long-chain-fatty-acid--CoA ligase n=1 Tax=Astyanax mexicanus TaxID=7994 RepID=A0A8B9LAR6_ASTMX